MDALYFNLDLTLTKMEKSFDEIIEETLLEVGVPEERVEETAEAYTQHFFDYFEDLEYNPDSKAFEDALEETGVETVFEPDEIAAISNTKEFEYIEPIDDLRPTLEKLSEKYNLGILTSGTSELQRAKIRKLGVSNLLEDVVISYERQATKTGDLFKEAEKSMEQDSRKINNYIYFSNSKSDIEAAENTGWETVYAGFEEIVDNPIQEIESRR